MATDDELIEAAADAARDANAGRESPGVVSLLRAVASTRAEHRRHEMARQVEARVGKLTDVALQILRVGIFALA